MDSNLDCVIINPAIETDVRHAGQRPLYHLPEYVMHKGQIIGKLTIIDTPEAFEPHVEWNALATLRGKYVGFLSVIGYLSKFKHVIMTAETKENGILEYFYKKNLIRKVGTIDNLSMGSLHMYQAVKNG